MADNDTAKVARDAALHALVSNGVYLALMLGIALAVSKRDELARLRIRIEQALTDDARQAAYRRALAGVRREISRMEHGGAETAAEPQGGPDGSR